MTSEPGDKQLNDRLESLRRIYAGHGDESPPQAVDAAILARARGAVRPARAARRWWVPASVAATVLIAFSLVMRVQQDTAIDPAGAPLAEREASLPAESGAAPEPDAGAAATAVAPAAPPADESEPMMTMEGTRREAPSVQPVLMAAPAATTAPAAAPAAEAALDAVPPQPTMKAGRAAPMEARAQALPPPEAWLERIEALEAEGKLEQAAAERERLEAAYPGWLAEHAAGQE